MSLSSDINTTSTALSDIKQAIINKGVTPTGDITTYASAIGNISGGGSTPVISPLSVTPSTTSQTITASSGTDGYSPISVSAVTSDIDSNITAGNIRDGVTILGVTGTYSGGGGGGQTGAIFLQQGSWSQDACIKGDYIKDIIGFQSVSADLIPNSMITGTFDNNNQCNIQLQSQYNYQQSGIYYVGIREFNTQNNVLNISITQSQTENVIVWGQITNEYDWGTQQGSMTYQLKMTSGKWDASG